MKTTIPFWYHPTTVLALDDDLGFLEFLKDNIASPFSTVIETDPNKALDYLKKNTYNTSQLADWLIEQNFETMPKNRQAETYDINLNQLKLRAFVPNRFQKTVVCLIDRHMDMMDGLEFCRIVKEVEKLPVKLILLTGVTTAEEAVDAFNEGKIDAYVEKRAKESTAVQVNDFLKKLARQQFEDMSKTIVNEGLSHSFAHLANPTFYDTFNLICKTENIAEFYLLDPTGSFFFVDDRGSEKILLVHPESDFEVMHTIASESDAPSEILQALKERQQYPMVFSHEVSVSLTGEAWNSVMAPVEEIKDQKLFYSLIDAVKFKGKSLV